MSIKSTARAKGEFPSLGSRSDFAHLSSFTDVEIPAKPTLNLRLLKQQLQSSALSMVSTSMAPVNVDLASHFITRTSILSKPYPRTRLSAQIAKARVVARLPALTSTVVRQSITSKRAAAAAAVVEGFRVVVFEAEAITAVEECVVVSTRTTATPT